MYLALILSFLIYIKNVIILYYRTKHVSFARSHTLTTFDDSVMPAAVSGNRFRRDCERLIDGRIVKVRLIIQECARV